MINRYKDRVEKEEYFLSVVPRIEPRPSHMLSTYSLALGYFPQLRITSNVL
jgi:hypothetical protein